jgi:hypothetical protein
MFPSLLDSNKKFNGILLCAASIESIRIFRIRFAAGLKILKDTVPVYVPTSICLQNKIRIFIKKHL